MRIPKSCPELDISRLAELPADVLARVFAESGPLPFGKYLHWDELRHRAPPEGLTREQWWTGVAYARQQLKKPLPVRRKNGEAFTYAQVDRRRGRPHFVSVFSRDFAPSLV